MEHILILNIYAFQNESHLREHLHVQINIFRIGLPDRSVLSKGDRAVDIGAAPLTVGRSAAERDMDGEDTVATSILVGGQERTQGIDVLVSNGAISPAHGPSVRKRERGEGVGEVLIIYLRIRRQYKCQLHGTYLREPKKKKKREKRKKNPFACWMHSLKASCRLGRAGSEVHDDGRFSAVTRVRAYDRPLWGTLRYYEWAAPWTVIYVCGRRRNDQQSIDIWVWMWPAYI